MNWQWFVAPGSALYLGPLAILAGAAVLYRERARKAVMGWWSAIAFACGMTAASKISFYGWGTGIRAWDLTCFSGHAVISMAVWPVVGMLAAPTSRPGLRAIGTVSGLVLAGLIGYSRIPLGAHPPSEVIAGTLLGGLVGTAGCLLLRHYRLPGTLLPAVGLVLLATMTMPRGAAPVLPSERWFAAIGTALSGREAPVSRKKWRNADGITISHHVHLRP